jgi:pilus assembly protein CpaE
MTRAVIAIADQVIVQELRSRLDEVDAEIEVVFLAESTSEMISSVRGHRPAVLFVHDQLGPASVVDTVRDLTLRNPGLAVMVVTTSPSAETYRAALDAGARGVLEFPFGLEDLNHRLGSVLEWAQTLRAAMTENPESSARSTDRGARMIAVAGAKGGVGTTVIASHLAWDVVRGDPNIRVCLVDLAVENGDVPSYLDVAYRVSIADLAKISEDLSPRAVSDTVVVHNSRLHLLLAPPEIRDTEYVTPEAVRRILAQLRGLYHLVVIDTGSAITTTQAAVVESADVTLQVVTADVPALRAARRQTLAWESLGVIADSSVKVVVNRFVRRSEIQQDTIDELVLGDRSEVLIPDLDRGLERAGNSRTPAEVRNQTWWKSLRALAQELDVYRSFRRASAAPGGTAEAGDTDADHDQVAGSTPRNGATNGQAANGSSSTGPSSTSTPTGTTTAGATGGKRSLAPAKPARRGRRAKQRASDSGQVALETVAMLPLTAMVVIICVQFVLWGFSFVWSGVAATAAARAASLGDSPSAAANEVLPAGVQGWTTVTSSGSTVRVRVSPPLLIGDGASSDAQIEVSHTVVKEPR